MSEDEYLLIVNCITSISLNFRTTVEVIECLNTYISYPEFVISKSVHFCTDLLQFIFSKANNLYSVLQQHNLRNQFVPLFVWKSIQQWESIHLVIQLQHITNCFCLIASKWIAILVCYILIKLHQSMFLLCYGLEIMAIDVLKLHNYLEYCLEKCKFRA